MFYPNKYIYTSRSIKLSFLSMTVMRTVLSIRKLIDVTKHKLDLPAVIRLKLLEHECVFNGSNPVYILGNCSHLTFLQ